MDALLKKSRNIFLGGGRVVERSPVPFKLAEPRGRNAVKEVQLPRQSLAGGQGRRHLRTSHVKRSMELGEGVKASSGEEVQDKEKIQVGGVFSNRGDFCRGRKIDLGRSFGLRSFDSMKREGSKRLTVERYEGSSTWGRAVDGQGSGGRSFPSKRGKGSREERW